MKKIRFNNNPAKSLEALLWVLNKKERNIYNILKIIFEADRYHLNKYGRPVTGDVYIAMDYGTVPSFLRDLIKLGREDFSPSEKNHLDANRAANLDYFSDSDIEALEVGFKLYANKKFKTVKEINHKNKAWDLTYKANPSGNAQIDFKDMIDDINLISELELTSGNIII